MDFLGFTLGTYVVLIGVVLPTFFYFYRSGGVVILQPNKMEFLGFTLGTYVVCIGVVLPTFFYFYRYLVKNDNYWKERGVFYESRPSLYTVFKTLLTKGMHELELERYKKYGRLHGFFEGRTPIFNIAEPDLLRDVLVKDFQTFTNRREMNSYDDMMNNSVSVLTGEQWKRVRTTMTPAFTTGKMKKMANIINECSKAVIDNFIKSAENGIPADCKKFFGTFAMDVIARSAFATKIDSYSDPNNPFVLHARNIFSNNFRMVIFMTMPSFILKIFRFNIIKPDTVSFFRNVVLHVIEERRKRGIRGNDFLQLMMDANDEQHEAEVKVDGYKMMEVEEDEPNDHWNSGEKYHIFKTIYENKRMTHDEVLAQCLFFFMVAYETTGATLSFAAYSLATNPDCQEKLIQEIDRFVEEKGELTYDSIREMKYLDHVISETLRMYPPPIRGEREASEDYKLGNTGITIPKGTIIGFPIYPMHHDPEFFSEPEKFKPERFCSENISHPPYAYLPFGAGPRNCLGMRFALMEVKLGLANVLRYMRFKTCPDTTIPVEYACSSGILSPKDVLLTVEKRKAVESL